MQRLSVLGALAALSLAATTPADAQTAMTLPQGDGRNLGAVACSQCHTLNTILVGREGAAGWKRHVYNMVLRGAQLSPREADTVIQYLAANFGPARRSPRWRNPSRYPAAPARSWWRRAARPAMISSGLRS